MRISNLNSTDLFPGISKSVERVKEHQGAEVAGSSLVPWSGPHTFALLHGPEPGG